MNLSDNLREPVYNGQLIWSGWHPYNTGITNYNRYQGGDGTLANDGSADGYIRFNLGSWPNAPSCLVKGAFDNAYVQLANVCDRRLISATNGYNRASNSGCRGVRTFPSSPVQ